MKAAIDANPGLFMHALLGGGAAMGGSAGGQPGAHAHDSPDQDQDQHTAGSA